MMHKNISRQFSLIFHSNETFLTYLIILKTVGIGSKCQAYLLGRNVAHFVSPPACRRVKSEIIEGDSYDFVSLTTHLLFTLYFSFCFV